MWNIIAGSRKALIVVIALVVGLILFLMTQYIQNTTRTQVEQEQRIEQIERQQRTRDRINEGIRNSPRDIDSIREWLQQRQSGQ